MPEARQPSSVSSQGVGSGMFETVDLFLFHAVNQFAGHSFALDRAVVTLTNNHLFKTVPFVVAYWWFWFAQSDRRFAERDQAERRFLVFSGLGAAVLACGLSRVAQNMMWERPRPINTPDLGANVPLGLADDYLANFSSFPSDNAAMTFSLAMGLFLISRRVGIVAFFWALVVACVPRVFAGFHYPSDILGGAVLGIVTTLLVVRFEVLRAPFRFAIGIKDRQPGLFYAAGFVASHQIATFFGDARELGEKVKAFIDIAM